MRKIFCLTLIFIAARTSAQHCDCEKEFIHIKNFIEENYAGFKDKEKQMTRAGYESMASRFQKLSRGAGDNCLLVISQYLDSFKDQHIQIGPRFDATKYDSVYIGSRRLVNLTAGNLKELSHSRSIEGIYNFIHDSSYKIAVIKNPSSLHDYIGVIIESKLPYWKKGQIKFEAKKLNDSMMKGILYVRNHVPKVEWFYAGRNQIGGDWLREGSVREVPSYNYEPVASAKLSEQTLYLKISSFSPSNAKNIDSLFNKYQDLLASMPYLILDIRDNSGGSDFAFEPILPYIYTGPVKNIGVDVLATEANIAGWKTLLDDEDLPADSKARIGNTIRNMENSKGKLVNIASDYVDSSHTPSPTPKKIAILINRGCASTAEQFLLYARQSFKVILMGENSQGTLDYSNMREKPFSCMPYVLRYATTRSRRLDIGQGIDNVGIPPHVRLKPGGDWVQEARRWLEAGKN